MFGIKTDENQRIALHTNSMGREGVLKRNGQTIESTQFMAYIAETNDTPARIDLQDAKITTFPNPFSDRISVRLENVNEGKADSAPRLLRQRVALGHGVREEQRR